MSQITRWQITKASRRLTNVLVLAVVSIGIWQITSHALDARYLLPSPISVAAELRAHKDMYLSATLITAEESVGGLTISIAVGLALVLAMYIVPRSEQYILPIAIILKATPIVAVAPMLVVWCGPGMSAKFIMAFLVSFFPILQNVHDGLRNTPEAPQSYAFVLGVTRMRELFFIRAKYAVPEFVSSLKVATPLAVVGAIVAEFVMPTEGLGSFLVRAVPSMDTPRLFATVTCVAIIGLSMYCFALLCEGWAIEKLHLTPVRGRHCE